MSTRYSILHISDLHKLEGTNYKALLESMLTDRQTYRDAGIIPPKYVVVSGDLIHGGNTEDEIRMQYTETSAFLDDIATEFLNGDKERMLIVPGNHDVNYSHSKTSMTPDVVSNNNKNLDLLKMGYPEIRWNWDDFKFYKITNINLYKKRFDMFKEFYNGFYGELRTYPDNPQDAAEVYSFEEDEVAFALFNSCNRLDHLNNTADIDENAIANVMRRLRSYYNRGFLNIAVWHHHYYGSPRETNYLDREIINKMSHSYIQMGLFGHQHISQIAEFYGGDLALGDSPENQRILLISTGTLFGGKKELPEGYKRQYNVIEIASENGKCDVRIHVREDNNRNIGSKLPIWQTKQMGPATSITTSVMTKKLDEGELLADIQRTAKETGDYISAFKRLKKLTPFGNLYACIRSEIIRNIKDNRFLIDNLMPETNNDYMILMSCAVAENDLKAKKRLKEDKKLQSMLSDLFIKEMYDRL